MSDAKQTPDSRYMTLDEAATALGLTRSAMYPRIYAGEFQTVALRPDGRGLRIVRKSFEAYCDRLEREGAKRFGAA